MFEDALVESGGRLKTKSNWWTIASLAFEAGILGILILFPLFNLEMLPKHILATLLIAPATPVAAPVTVASAAGHEAQGSSEFKQWKLIIPNTIPARIAKIVDGPAVAYAPNGIPGANFGDGTNASMPFALADGGSNYNPPMPKAQPPAKPRRISSGVMDGYALYQPQPPYPAIARAAHIQGDVVLEVTVSKNGTIENLNVLSGNRMLAGGALDAVRNWRYRPYLLNGEAVEVQMQVTVRFILNG